MIDLGSSWLDNIPMLGEMAPAEVALKLRELGEDSLANAIVASLESTTEPVDTFGLGSLLNRKPRPWQFKAHTFGFIPSGDRTKMVPIKHAGTVPADAELKNATIKITLDGLRIADYPGHGTHHVLFGFSAQHQEASAVEGITYNAIFEAKEGEHAPVTGCPIFIGLKVGSEGVLFKCLTVNVKNSDDEQFLRFLDCDILKEGLKLVSSVQPALRPLSVIAAGLTKAIANRSRNVPVQRFTLGLDFSSIRTRARLSEGSYVVVQVADEAEWNWSDWVFNSERGQVVSRSDGHTQIPYNYMIFSVSRCDAV